MIYGKPHVVRFENGTFGVRRRFLWWYEFYSGGYWTPRKHESDEMYENVARTELDSYLKGIARKKDKGVPAPIPSPPRYRDAQPARN